MDLGAGREHERVQRASVNLRLVVRRGRPPEGRQVARHAAAREVEQLERGTPNTTNTATKNTTTKMQQQKTGKLQQIQRPAKKWGIKMKAPE
jgi:hypothetical protein